MVVMSTRIASGGTTSKHAPQNTRLVAAGLLLFASALGKVDASETLSVGGRHACVITTTGGVKCWGLNSKGQLGYEDTTKRGSSSLTMGDALEDVNLGTGRTAVSITAGDLHTCAVLDDDSLKCWGFGNYGQLGQEDALSRGEIAGSMGDALLPVDLGTGRTAQKAVAGEGFTCVLLDNSEVVCFGRNASGQLGIGTSKDIGKEAGEMGDELVGVNFGSDFRYAVDISSGPCALLDDGAVKCWGANLYGSTGVPGSVDVGTSTGDMGDSLPEVSLGTALTASWVGSGMYHNCAIVDGGDVKCWGKNTQGNLGIGDVHDRGNDEGELGDQLPFTYLSVPAYRLDGGTDHTCALLTDNSVKCWGYNFVGTLGLGDYKARGDYPNEMGDDLSTVFLGVDRTAVEISAGGNSACAILEDGSVKCWGDGSSGKLGQGNSRDIGDGTTEMMELSNINLGTGVKAAAPVLPTLDPTSAPTSAPIATQPPTPTDGRPPSPSTQPETTAPTDDMKMTVPTGDMPSPAPVDQPPTAMPVLANKNRSSKDSKVSWEVVTVAVLAPCAAVALMAGGYALHRKRQASKAPASPIDNL